MSVEIMEGYDLRLRGRVSRYRVIAFRPSRKMIVQRHHRTLMRPHGRQIEVGLDEVTGVCVGLGSDHASPVWQEITGWMNFPKMPDRWFAVVTSFTGRAAAEQRAAIVEGGDVA